MKLSYKEHPYILSTIMALGVAILFNICFLLFVAYGEYITKTYDNEEQATEMVMPPHEGPDMGHHEPPMMGKTPPPAMHDAMAMEENMPPKDTDLPLMMLLRKIAINFVSTFILFAVCFNILFKWKRAEWKKVTAIAVASLLWIVLCTLVATNFMAPHDDLGPGRVHFMRAITTVSLFLGLIVFLSSLLIYYIYKGHEAAIENETLRTLNYSTQYEALKSKLNPHFLFNALNTLSGLIAIKSEHTEEYIQKLSTIFRTTLSHEDVTTLRDELSFASAFGDLMTIRYEESLKITYDIPEGMRERKIVTFGVQTLLENVIKHNTITTRLPMEISVRAEEGYVIVSNPIHPRKETEQGNGLGLKLLSERCQALMGRDIVIDDKENTFTVKIPIGYE